MHPVSAFRIACLSVLTCLAPAFAQDRPAPGGPSGIILLQSGGMDEVIRLDVRDGADRDTRGIRSDARYMTVQVCAAENTVRIRRAEIQLGNGRWQRLFLPLALKAGACSEEIALLGAPRRLRAIQFDYEAWTAGYARATVIVYARPVARQ
jgi:hypothetical protein